MKYQAQTHLPPHVEHHFLVPADCQVLGIAQCLDCGAPILSLESDHPLDGPVEGRNHVLRTLVSSTRTDREVGTPEERLDLADDERAEDRLIGQLRIGPFEYGFYHGGVRPATFSEMERARKDYARYLETGQETGGPEGSIVDVVGMIVKGLENAGYAIDGVEVVDRSEERRSSEPN